VVVPMMSSHPDFCFALSGEKDFFMEMHSIATLIKRTNITTFSRQERFYFTFNFEQYVTVKTAKLYTMANNPENHILFGGTCPFWVIWVTCQNLKVQG